MSTALVTAREQRLGYASHSNPDWFLESQDTIAPLLQQRNLLYNRWVRSGLNDDHSRYKAACSKARTEIRRAKTHWFDQVASKVDLGRKTCHGNRFGRPSGPSNGMIKAVGLFMHLLSGMRTV